MADWDNDAPASTSTFGTGFGRGGLGRGKLMSTGSGLGRGRGKRMDQTLSSIGSFQTISPFGQPSDDWGDPGSFGCEEFIKCGQCLHLLHTQKNGGTTNGFSNGGSTFGSSNNNDDDWGDGGGFSSKGFGRSDDDNAPSGGGFKKSSFGGGGGTFGGGDRSGSRACYKCGEEGHMSRECPSAGGSSGGGGSRACFKCGEEGHMSRECPSGGGGGGGGSRACFKCGEEGHMSRECPSAGGGGGGGSRACFKCGEEGHMSRECPSGGGGGGGGSRACFKCGEEGHMSRECPNSESSGGGGGNACFKCKEEGHMARDCPNATEDEKKHEIYVPPAPPEDEESIFTSEMQRGINFDKYDDIPVEVTGDDAPKGGLKDFDDADLSTLFRSNVAKAKYDRPTPVQKWAIPIIRKGRDLMACAQTGSGKTAAFLLPVLTGMVEAGSGGGQFDPTQKPMALIIGPTRELVIQIFNEARKFAHGSVINPVVVYGGTSVAHQSNQLMKGANMVIGTPGRLDDFVTRGKISLENVKYLILDEADRMLDMGFEPVVRKLVEQCRMPAKTERQTLMFSATFPDEIQRLARDFLERYLFVTVGRVGAANTDITQTVYEVTQFAKRDKLVELLNDSGQDRVLVFVETKRNADFLASYLSQSEFPTTSIHGDRLQREREEALQDFKKGRAPILVATSVAARGLDIPGVMHVVNYDLPSSIDEYVHRIGRTGRCGNLGKATSFFDGDKNQDIARSLVKVLEDARQEVPSFLEQAAEEGTGTGFAGAGGRFGARDTRRGNFGGGGDGGTDGDFSTQAEEDESWD